MQRSWCISLLILAWLVCPLSASALGPEAQAAKDEGMRLWGQHEWIEMQPYLEQAAEAGDVESMYYLGEANRLLDRGLSHDAMDWYLQAAEHDDPYAMLRLWGGGACVAGDYCPEDAEGWREKARDEQLPLAEEGDAKAMLALYYIYGAMDDSDEGNVWLEKAAEAGNPEAQDRLSKMILDGYGFYWSDGSRLEAAETLARDAAEQGYVPAMHTLSGLLSDKGQEKESWEWLVKASEDGSRGARLKIGWCYLNPEEYGSEGGGCFVDQDVMKGWSILYAIDEEVDDNTAESIMSRNRSLLSYDQRQQAEETAEDEWLNNGPPLSKFPPKYGF